MVGTNLVDNHDGSEILESDGMNEFYEQGKVSDVINLRMEKEQCRYRMGSRKVKIDSGVGKCAMRERNISRYHGALPNPATQG